MAARDLTGRVYGRLTVKGRAQNYVSPAGCTKPAWWASCSCGSETIWVVGQSLADGVTRSCGCLRTDVNKSRGEKRKDILSVMSEEDRKEMIELNERFKKLIANASNLDVKENK